VEGGVFSAITRVFGGQCPGGNEFVRGVNADGSLSCGVPSNFAGSCPAPNFIRGVVKTRV